MGHPSGSLNKPDSTVLVHAHDAITSSHKARATVLFPG